VHIVAELLYRIAALLLAVTWLVYPAALFILSRSRRLYPAKRNHPAGNAPRSVTALVVAWNEEKEIGARVRNLARQKCAGLPLGIFVASDGSSDSTLSEAVKAAPGRVVARHFPRRGKSATLNLAMREICDEIVILSDADTDFAPDCVERLLEPFTDPEVGCVTGTMISRDGSLPLSKDQGLYWRFENHLRLCESENGILVTAAGACMALRRELFEPLAPTRGDDCMIPLDIARKGYRIVHAPGAVAFDTFPASLRGEIRARTRMTARNIAGIFDRPELLNPLRHPGYAASLWFHKIFRWLTPLFALMLLCTSVSFAGQHPLSLTLELMYFILAGVGGSCTAFRRPVPRAAAAAFSFLVANVGFAAGIVRWIGGKEITVFTNIRDTFVRSSPV
jgi:cellulose synthase/poly-beta-1,6-N-acetylglucosamine synthase-like glycosyltransferase